MFYIQPLSVYAFANCIERYFYFSVTYGTMRDSRMR